MALDYNKIFLAHYKTQQSLMLWGSSGYGKTSIVKAFADHKSFELMTVHAQYLDPLALFIPSTQAISQKGFVQFYPSEILHKIFMTKRRTILFLDELTRASEETFNILTELLLDRCVFGYKIPKHVLIIAASNFAEEDHGVRDMPDAVMQRLTHLIHAPSPEESIDNMRSSLARKMLEHDTELLQEPANYPIHDLLKPCPRQIDACATIAETGLSGDNLMAVCRGRIGIEKGTELAIKIEMYLSGKAKMLPDAINSQELSRIAQAEHQGGVLEVVNFLCHQMLSGGRLPYIANYLLEFASPEVCRALQVHGFSFSYPNIPRRLDGSLFNLSNRQGGDPKPIEVPGKPWQWYAIRIGKLVPR
ncbi:MAG: ATP-binding protein [Oligoflexales bacterium]